MAEIRIKLDLVFSQRLVTALGVAAMMLWVVPDLESESLTLSTYYPAPSGVYTQMIATENTWLARDSGAVIVGAASSAESPRPTRMTIRTGNLDVLDGTVRMANLASDPAGGRDGEIYYTNAAPARFRGHVAGAWQDLAPALPVVFRNACRGCKDCSGGGTDTSWCGPADARLSNARCAAFVVIQNQNDGDQDQVEELGCFIDDVARRLYFRLETSGGDDEETSRESACGAICGGTMVINP